MSKAVADLLNEHEAILTALQILDRMIPVIEKSPLVDEKDIRDFIGFLKEFADKCHHGKEEGLLFPAMVKAGVPEQGGPIGVLLAEHVRGRELIREMEAALASLDRARLAEAGRGYASLLRVHIHKENGVFFPMAERLLSEDALETLYQGFQEHEETVMGGGRHAELHALLHSLEEKYPG
jgi:hemerythrin-like domain-containing protein